MCLALAARLAGQGTSSLSDKEIEFAETRLTLQSVVQDNQSLRRELETARETIRALTHSVAFANQEAEVFRRLTTELKLQMEALGLESADPDRGPLEQRLLGAVRDLQLENEEKLRIRDRLVRLAEAVVRYLPTATGADPGALLEVESALRGANETLGSPGGEVAEAAPVDPGLTEGMVISVKEEYSLIVANMGAGQGVKIGMPFGVWRGDSRIGLLRVVDVREKLCGAVIQSLQSDDTKIQVGDRLRVETN